MSGIYIHVPFCLKKCDYCDFYSVVGSNDYKRFTETVVKEIDLRQNYLPDKKIDTIYFGGGTPSLLRDTEIKAILNAIYQRFTVSQNPEITLEANPDDLSYNYLNKLLATGINRLSIGVQSFSDDDLHRLGRRHSASQAATSVQWAYDLGFNNIGIDLIYGLPYSTSKIWANNLKIAFDLPIKHLSCYHLIYEEGTPLYRELANKTITQVDEEKSVEQFEILQRMASENNFVHYEISNLAIEGYFSRHNTSYWKQVPYLGVGPAAHSYNGETRNWNPKSLTTWFTALDANIIESETEVLTSKNKINDYLLTSLRTIWGVNLEYISTNFGDKVKQRIQGVAKKYIEHSIMEQNGTTLRIKPNHFLTSDGIIADFFEETDL